MFSSDENQRKKFKKKRRKRTNEKMKTIIKNIEKEIETQLSAKDEKNDFTTTNIEAILKEVIMDEDIKEMVRQTIQQGDSKSLYEPKLTRAKIRELLKLRPDLSFPILWPMTTKKNTNFVSECLSLINANYSENSSEDEEYKPEKEDQCIDYPSSSFPIDGSTLTSVGSVSTGDSSNSKDNAYFALSEPEENIGQRTRSKLPLTDTPLEVIEQAFVPPDITIDMYETEIDNEDWLNFIKGFVQPLDNKCNEPTDLDDDPDDDPEYNISNDVETVDREELRKDRGVDVPRQEVHDLIAELFRDCEPMNSLMSDTSFTEDITEPPSVDPLPFDVLNTEEVPVSVNEPTVEQMPSETNENSASIELPLLLPAQLSLLNQQMRQHVQMLTMNFLQFYKHPIYSNFANEVKTLLFSINNLCGGNENSAFSVINLNSAVKVVNDWQKSHAHLPQPKLNLFEHFSKKKKQPIENFPKDVMKTVTMSEAFLYPLLLPHKPFGSFMSSVKYKRYLLDSEEWLLAIGLEQFIEFVKQTSQNKLENDVLKEAINLITVYILPCFTKKFLYQHIKKRCSEPDSSNPIKMYFEKGRAPALTHYVIPIVPKPLFKQPYDLLPDIWADYVEKNYVVVKKKDTK